MPRKTSETVLIQSAEQSVTKLLLQTVSVAACSVFCLHRSRFFEPVEEELQLVFVFPRVHLSFFAHEKQ